MKIETLKQYYNHITNLLVILTTSFAAFKTYYYYEQLDAKMKRIENINELIDSKLNKTHNQVIELSDTVVSNLLKLDTSIKSLNPDLFLTKQNGLLLKMLETPNVPIINIVSDNTQSKIMTIGLCLLILGVTAFVIYYYIPAVAVFTKKQVLAFSLISNDIISKIPGSNSADGICYLPTYNVQLLTKIKSGYSTHTVIDLITQKEYTLTEFIATRLSTVHTQAAIKAADTVPHIINGLDISSIL